MPLLIGLLLTGCASSRPEPAYIQDPGGNAWVITLPKGSQVVLSNPGSLIAASNEIGQDGVLKSDCVIVSPSYLQIRDEREIELLRIIEELKIKADQ